MRSISREADLVVLCVLLVANTPYLTARQGTILRPNTFNPAVTLVTFVSSFVRPGTAWSATGRGATGLNITETDPGDSRPRPAGG